MPPSKPAICYILSQVLAAYFRQHYATFWLFLLFGCFKERILSEESDVLKCGLSSSFEYRHTCKALLENVGSLYQRCAFSETVASETFSFCNRFGPNGCVAFIEHVSRINWWEFDELKVNVIRSF